MYLKKVIAVLVFLMLLFSASAVMASRGKGEEEAETPQPAEEKPAEVMEAEEKPVIIMALDSDLDNLEPSFFKTDSAYYLVSNVYQPLLKEKYKAADSEGRVLMGTLTFEPDGAGTFSYSEDGCAVFKIRRGMKFMNGGEVNAHSFKYGIDRALLGPGYLASLLELGGVTDAGQVQIVDDYTLTVCTEQRTPMFESLFAFSVIPAMDGEFSKSKGTDDDPWGTEWYRTNVNGSGPYILKEWTPGEQYIVEPNPDYWRGEDYYQNSRIVAKLIPSPQDRELLLKSGAVDVAIGLPFKDVESLKKDPNVNILEIPYSRVRFLGWNNQIAPFDDVRVRRALMHAVPYKTILEKAVYGHGRPARNIIPSDFETSDQEYWPYDTNPAKAKKMLADAGFDGLDLELAIRLSIPEDVEASVWIQSAFSEIGVNVKVNKMTDAQFFDKLMKHELAFFIHDWYSWLHDPFYQFNWLARCGMGTNYVDYCNPEFDELYQKGLYEQDPKKRAEISVKMQHMWLDDAPWAPLYHPNWIIGTSPTFKGFVVDFGLMLQYAQMTK